MKKLIIALAFGFGLVSLAQASPESKVTADPTFEDGGNCWRLIQSSASQGAIIIISSAPANAVRLSSTTRSLDISVWRKREITNTSNLGLFLQNTPKYTSYISSFGVVLSSDSKGMGQGDSWIVPHQGPVYGIWSPGNSIGGAGGYETWGKQGTSAGCIE